MGTIILIKAFRKISTRSGNSTKEIMALGFIGGFFDAVGGGGWGPIVTSTLVANGNNPRFVVGTVDTSEFLVTVAQSVTFFLAVREVNLIL